MEQPKLRVVAPEWYELTESYSYVGESYLITARRTFRCDLASVPRWLRSLVGHHELGLAPPLIHDLLYACQGNIGAYPWGTMLAKRGGGITEVGRVTRREADVILYDMMIDSGIEISRALPAYLAVRTAGAYAWIDTRPGDERY